MSGNEMRENALANRDASREMEKHQLEMRRMQSKHIECVRIF